MRTWEYYAGAVIAAPIVAVWTIARVLRDPLARAGLWGWFAGCREERRWPT